MLPPPDPDRRVRTRPAVQPIVPAVAEQLVRVRPTEQEVGPGAPRSTSLPRRPYRVLAFPLPQDVVARAADEPLDADEGVGPLPRRLPGAEVRADPPRGEVVPGEIEPTPTVDRVVATQAEELVLLPVADERVGEPAAAAPSTPSSVALIPGPRPCRRRGPRCRRPSRPRARRSRTRPRRSRCRSRRRARSGRPHPRRSRRRRPACPEHLGRDRADDRAVGRRGGVVPSAATAAGRSRRR